MKRFLVLTLGLLVVFGLSGAGEAPLWEVHWYVMTAPGEHGVKVGTGTFPFIFSYDWGDGPVFGEFRNFIGFKAFSNLFIPADMTITFQLAGNNGIALFHNGEAIIFCWEKLIVGVGFRRREVDLFMEKGWHRLELWYFEWEEGASFSFDFDIQEEELFFAFVNMGQEMEILLEKINALKEWVNALKEWVTALEERVTALEE